MLKGVLEELRQHVDAEIYTDRITKKVYSVDASIFEIEPLGVIIPKTKFDTLKTVQILSSYQIPITARGAATGITGGCLGRGFIIDTSKYLNQVLEINIEKEYVICEPGVIQDDLNQLLTPYHYRLGPDTSTGNRATLGGMLANNAAGSRSLRYGSMKDHVQAVELILASGEILYLDKTSLKDWLKKIELNDTEGILYRKLYHIRENYQEEIFQRFPKTPRRVSGYNLDELIHPEEINLAKLIAGSEGTLGLITAIKMRIVPKQKQTGICLISFDNMIQGMQAVPFLLEYKPLALEMIDNQIIQLGRNSPSLKGQLDWLTNSPKTLFIVELEGKTFEEIKSKTTQFKEEVEKAQIGAVTVLLDPVQMAKVWTLRKAGLGILLSKRSYNRAIAFLEDIAVPPQQLASFMVKFCTYLQNKGKWAGIYGHVGAGCMHIRPYMNVQQVEEYDLIKQMMLDVTEILLEHGGTLSGEHGDGLIRSWLNPKLFGVKLTEALIKVKQAFDPENHMNPGKIVWAESPFAELRANPSQPVKEIKTFLNFSKEGGLSLAADLCNGNGLCRKKETVMCPSFQATQTEFHSTRARAQALRAIIHGRLPIEDLTSHGMHAVMDLCLSCKGCKTECPSQVDMAKMKAEFLYHYQEKHGYSLRSRLFAHIGQISQLMFPLRRLFNYFNQLTITKYLLSWIGISPKRSLPRLTEQKFSTWFKSYVQVVTNPDQTVVLLNDTFTEFYHPEIGQAAVKILNALNYKVIVPDWQCCGRPAISKGLLSQAKRQVIHLFNALKPYLEKNIPIVGLEPSCLLTIRDDYGDFFPDQKTIQTQLSNCLTLDEFLAQQVDKNAFTMFLEREKKEVKVHGHCYQKALVGMQPTLKVLQAIPGLLVTEIKAGCCGMAGSFGYEKEHEAISLRIGELKLFPSIRSNSPSIVVVASGTSCREQIKAGTGKQALHLAEILVSHLNL